MGEEEKKTEEKVEGGEKKQEGEEKKPEEVAAAKEEKKEGDGGEKKVEGGDGGEKKETPPPPPEEIVMRVFMHCEGCARKVKRSLRAFEGVEDVKADCKTHKVVVKGKIAAADPLKVVERVQKKTGRKVELLTPIPPKPEEEKKKEDEKEKPKQVEKKEEPPVITVVLKVHMHCEACSQEIKKRILKMKGVESADPDLKASQVTVKGVFDPSKLVGYVYKRTGKHAIVVKQEPVEKKADDKGKHDKDAASDKSGPEGGGDKDAGGEGENKESKEPGGGGEQEKEKKEAAEATSAATATATATAAAYYAASYPRYLVEYAYTPQIFSDENPNACSVM